MQMLINPQMNADEHRYSRNEYQVVHRLSVPAVRVVAVTHDYYLRLSAFICGRFVINKCPGSLCVQSLGVDG
jgi:hypothetical protein